MEQSLHDRKYNYFGFDSLFYNWAISVGALAVVLFAAAFISKLYLPVVVIAMEFLAINMLRRSMQSKLPNCNILLFLTTRILLITAIIMVGINLYIMKFVPYHYYAVHAVNRNIPYITVLIMGPVSFLVLIGSYFYRRKFTFCKECRIKFGTIEERGFMGKVFSHETIYQMRVLIAGTGVISVCTWVYYYLYYSNVNFNPSDKFYFIWVPVMLYLLSTVYMAMRYVRIYEFYKTNIVGDALGFVSSTNVRFQLQYGNKLFLALDEEMSEVGRRPIYETPAEIMLPLRMHMSETEVEDLFEQVTGISRERVKIRKLYTNANAVTLYTIHHYLCTVDDMSVVNGSKLSGEWLDQREIGRLYKEKCLAPLLMTAIHRVYTIMSAAKTYDIQGRRRYEIKHYKPSVRLSELANPDIDFNNSEWLIVAEENEDKPFYRLRRFWRRYVSGTEA